MKRTIKNTYRTCGTLLAFMISLMLTTTVFAGELLFSFDSHNAYVQEGQQLYIIPSALFEMKHGKAAPGDRVSLLDSELKFKTYETTQATKEVVANKKSETEYSNYGGRVYAFSAPYYYLMKEKVVVADRDLQFSPRNIEFTWAPGKAPQKAYVQRNPATVMKDKYEINEKSVSITGTLVKSESLGTVAVKSENAIFWLKEEALENSVKGAADTLEFEVSKDQVLWIAGI